MTQWVYDGQPQIVQTQAATALAAVQSALAANLTAPGPDASAALAQDLSALALYAPDNSGGYAAALQQLLADYVAGVIADAAAAARPSPAPPAGFAYASRLPPMPLDPSFGLAALASGAWVPGYVTAPATEWFVTDQSLTDSGAVAI